MPNKLERKYQRAIRVNNKFQDKFDGETSFGGRTNKTRRLCHLENLEKVQIVHEVLVQHQKQKDVAKFYQIKPSLVGRLVKKARENEKFFQELREIENINLERDENIAEIAKKLCNSSEGLWKSQEVIDGYREKHDAKVSQR